MADSGSLPIVQINLHHRKSTSAILTRSMSVMQIGITLIQKPWLLNDNIKKLGGGGAVSSMLQKPPAKLELVLL